MTMPRGSSHFRSLHQGVAHEHVVLLRGGPLGFGPFIRIHHRGATFRSETNGLLEVFDADLRFAQRRMRRQARELDPGPGAGTPEAQWVVQHRDAVEVTCFAEKLPPPMHHRFDVFIAELGCFGHAPLEGFVRVADEFHVDPQFDFRHGIFFFLIRVS